MGLNVPPRMPSFWVTMSPMRKETYESGKRGNGETARTKHDGSLVLSPVLPLSGSPFHRVCPLSSPADLPVPQHNELGGGEFLQPHGTAGVDPGRGNADLGPE